MLIVKRSHKTNISNSQQFGFTIIEMMIVIAIIGVLAAITYPSYQRYIIKSKRADMMSEMHNIASEIQSRKLAQGSYSEISAATITEFNKDYPAQGPALYAITLTPDPLTSEWTIFATPKTGTQLATDGNLSLDYQGIKCRDINGTNNCGTDDNWQD